MTNYKLQIINEGVRRENRFCGRQIAAPTGVEDRKEYGDGIGMRMANGHPYEVLMIGQPLSQLR